MAILLHHQLLLLLLAGLDVAALSRLVLLVVLLLLLLLMLLWGCWLASLLKLLENLVQVLLVGGGVAVEEPAGLLVVVAIGTFFVGISDALEARQSWDSSLCVDIDILELGVLHTVLVPLLGDLLLEHLQLFLILLHADVHAVDHDIRVNWLRTAQGVGALLVAEAAGTGHCWGRCGLLLILNCYRFWREGRAVGAQCHFGQFWLLRHRSLWLLLGNPRLYVSSAESGCV